MRFRRDDRLRPLVLIAALIAAPLVYVGVSRAREAMYAGRLPALPDLEVHTEAVRAHITQADRAARADPASANAVGALCLSYHADMFYEQAERCYALVERLSGGEWRWTYYRALTKGERGDADGLTAGLRQVIAVAPGVTAAWWRLGDVEFKRGRYDLAEEAWRRAMALPEPERPDPPSGRPKRVSTAPLAAYSALGLARIAMARKDAEAARRLLEAVTATDKAFGPAFRLLGDAYAVLGRPVDAARSTRTADALSGYDPYVDPMVDTLVYESRSSTFLLQQAAAADLTLNGQWREYAIRRALEFDPGNHDALYELASTLRVLGRWDEALGLLDQHRRAAPGNVQVLADMARCLSGLGRFREAETFLRLALKEQDAAGVRADLGLVLDRLGRPEEAIAEYRRALAGNPHHRDALNNLGVLLASRGRFAEAALELERLTTVDPGNVNAHTNLGAILLAQGARDRAADSFRRALALSPDDARARQGLATIGQ